MDILLDRFSTSTLLFIVIKLGLNNIKNEEARMEHVLFFAFLFITDFVSYWFQVYSIYLIEENVPGPKVIKEKSII
jgi:hypothetical protein